MIQFNNGSIIWSIPLILSMFSNKRKSFYWFVFFSVCETVSLFNIGDNSILIVHIGFVISALKVFLPLLVRKKISSSVSVLLTIFILWCLITIPFSLCHNNTIVLNIEDAMEPVNFDYHQFSQFGYLLIGFISCLMCNHLLIQNVISIEDVFKAFELAYIFTLLVALLQHILPVEIINNFFRNAANTGYTYEGARISGTFSEPSMLSLYCAPLFAGYVYRLFADNKLKFFSLSALFLIVLLDNQSSSGIIAILLTAILIFVIQLVSAKKVKLKSVLLILATLLFTTVVAIIEIEPLTESFELLIEKLSGEGVSGSERMYLFLYHLNLGLTHLLPTGYGTVRSYDLFTTWLCSIGIVGLVLYGAIVLQLCVGLSKKNDVVSWQLFLCIVIHNVIMLISVPEISYLSLWIYYGLGYYLISKKEEKVLSSK